MPALVRLSLYDDHSTKRYCSGAICNLTCDSKLCPRLLDEGVLTALSELSKSSSEEIRRNTAITLCRSSFDRQGQIRLVQEGAQTLLTVLHSSDFDTREATVKALINMASFSGSPIPENVVQALIEMVRESQAPHGDMGDRNEFLARVILNLSILPGCRVKVIDDGLLKAIVNLARGHINEASQLSIACALCNFSGIHANLGAMADIRVLECLKILLASERDEIREMCAISMANLSCNSAALDHMVLHGMIPQLVRIGMARNAAIMESVAQCLSNMAALEENRPPLTKEGTIGMLVQYLKDGNIKTKQYAVIALCNIMVHPSARGDVIKHNIVPCLVALSKSPNEKIREICALALYNLSCDDGLQTLIISNEPIAALMKLSESPMKSAVVSAKSPAKGAKTVALSLTQDYCLGAIFNLSFQPKSRELLARNKVIPMLTSLFCVKAKPRSPKKMQQCATIISNLSFDVDCRSRIVSDNGIPIIRILMHSLNKETLVSCSTALCNVALEAHPGSSILPMLIKLAGSQHTEIILNCAMAFSKLAAQTGIRSSLVKCEEFAPTLTVMMRSGHEDIQINAAITLCNLACEEGEKEEIWTAGTVPDFIVNSLLRVNSNTTKEICARGLFNLLTHDKSRPLMIKKGVLYALVKLARLESVEIRQMCVVALYNLSCDPELIPTLMDMNAVQVVTKMCEAEYANFEIRRLLTATLVNIAMVEKYRAKVVEGGALSAVKMIFEYSDQFSCRNCAHVLLSLSFCPEGKAQMASESLFTVIAGMITSRDIDQIILGLNTICNLTCSTALHGAILQSGKIKQVLKLLDTSTDAEVSLVSTQILCNLVYGRQNFEQLLQDGLLPSLTHMLNTATGSDSQVYTVCSKLIAQLCVEPSIIDELNRTGAGKILSICATRCAETAKWCLASACHLSRSKEAEYSLVADGVMDIVQVALPDTVTDESIPYLTQISILLRNLATFKKSRVALAQDRRIVLILIALVRTEDRDICRNCAFIAYNLVLNTPHVDELEKLGIVPVLIELSQSGNPEIRQICAVTLAHLNSELPDERSSLQNGLVTTLISMLDIDQESVRKIDTVGAALAPPIEIAIDEEESCLPGVGQVDHEIKIDWTCTSAPFDETRYSPSEFQSNVEKLTCISAEATSCVQDCLHGTFEIMTVSNDKVKVEKLGEESSPLKSTRSVVTTFEGLSKTRHSSMVETGLSISGETREAVPVQSRTGRKSLRESRIASAGFPKI